MIEQRPPLLLRLKLLLRDVHPVVWRRVKLADRLSIADLHRVIQLLMGWDDDHLHRFRIHGRDCGIACVGGPSFDEDAAVVRLAQFGFRPTERFLYEYDFTAGWQVEVRVEKVIEEAPCESHRIPGCLVGREPGPPDDCDGPRAYAERRRDAVSWGSIRISGVGGTDGGGTDGDLAGSGAGHPRDPDAPLRLRRRVTPA